MDATPYIQRIRTQLQDYEDASRQGQFWSPYFVLLALQEAQNLIVSRLIKKRLHPLLRNIVSNVSGTPGPVSLPTDYLHYVSATIGQPERTAQLYLGAEGLAFLHTRQDAAVIVGQQVYFVDSGNFQGSGKLYYYRYPSPFVTPTDVGFTSVQEFDLAVYDIIVNCAVALLGRAETYTQREQRKDSKVEQAVTEGPARSVVVGGE